MGKKGKKKNPQPHRSKGLLVNYDRIFDSLVQYIKQNPDERTRLWNLARAGFRETGERGMLVCKHHEPEKDQNGMSNPKADMVRSPAELASALEYWPHSRCIKDFPSYGPGRWDGRDGRPRGCPGSIFRYDGEYQYAVNNHRFSLEVLLAVFTFKGEDGSPADNINMGSFAAPVGMKSDGSLVPLDTESLKNIPNHPDAKVNPYHQAGDENDGGVMGISIEVPATYCAREGCTVCEFASKSTFTVNNDSLSSEPYDRATKLEDCKSSEKVTLKAPKGSRVKLMKCSRCKTVQYCSKECQKMDWKRHKELCGLEPHPVTSAAALGVC